MTKRTGHLISAIAMVGLIGCGTLNAQSPASGMAKIVKAKIEDRLSDAPPPAAAPGLTRAAVDANPGAFLLMSRGGGAAPASLVQAGINGNKVTWLSADQVSVTLEYGLLVASRGFAQDMMAADITQVIQALVDSGGTAVRAYEYLDGLDQISTQLLQCSIASGGTETVTILGNDYSTERFDEDCTNDSIRFTNVYWINDDGRIVQSRQLVSHGVGYVEITAP